MSRKPQSAALPDLDDADFTAKLRPLGDALMPKTGNANDRTSVRPDTRTGGKTDTRESRLSVAERMEAIERIRGPKRRFEYLIPVRVGEALAEDAATKGKSAATRLLEVLRDAGYPVIPEDFADLRKERGR
ncbi:MAG: hypothetical protein ABSC06_29435 [Rhodopila sp.]|jgi:hypothetical protein